MLKTKLLCKMFLSLCTFNTMLKKRHINFPSEHNYFKNSLQVFFAAQTKSCGLFQCKFRSHTTLELSTCCTCHALFTKTIFSEERTFTLLHPLGPGFEANLRPFTGNALVNATRMNRHFKTVPVALQEFMTLAVQ